MKHVGLNVAADPLFTASYIGVAGGLLVVNADDPDMHSSQNEQDNRHYARAAKLPMLEPSDSQEACRFTKLALELSETYDTPVILRTTTRISHSKSTLVCDGEPAASLKRKIRAQKIRGIQARLQKIRHDTRVRAGAAQGRGSADEKAGEDASSFEINRMEIRDTSFGIITSGSPTCTVARLFRKPPS